MNLKQFYTGKALGFIILVLLLVGFYTFNKFIYNTKQSGPVTTCFTRNTEDGGYGNIEMTVLGEEAEGTFEWKVAGKDLKTGPFKGVVVALDEKNQVLNGLWKTESGGKTVKEELEIKFGSGVASPAFGEMTMRDDGIYIYKNLEKIVYGPNLSLIDCVTESVN